MTIKETAKEIVADASEPASVEEVRATLDELINTHAVPEEKAEHSVRHKYDAVVDTSPPTDTRAPEMLETLADGDIAAVRTTQRDDHDRRYVVAGVVELSEDLSGGWVATLHDATAWAWEPGKPETAERYLDLVDDVGPPKDVRHGYKNEYNTEPGLHISDRGGLEVLTLSPTWSTGGVEYYMPVSLGVVETVQSGQIVEPRRLLPDGAEVAE